MVIFIFKLCLLLGLVPHAAAVCDSSCLAAQKLSLQQLYSDLNGPQWSKQQGWAQATAAYCSWDGVRCCSSDNVMQGSTLACPLEGAVAGLDLAANNLAGAWPTAALAGLAASLVHLNLRSNQLSGPLPNSIQDLTELQRLYIDNNKLSGQLPSSLGTMTNLTQLSAASNSFSGPLPASLSNLAQLQWLLLDSNKLTGGLDGTLLQLPQLQVLNLQDNQLSGPLPALTGSGEEHVWSV